MKNSWCAAVLACLCVVQALPLWAQPHTTDPAAAAAWAAQRAAQAQAQAQTPAQLPRGFAESDNRVSMGEYTFPLGRTAGKWYAEIAIHRSLMNLPGGRSLQLGVDNVDGFYAIADWAAARQPQPGTDDGFDVYALAIDLDRRELSWRDGSLQGGPQPLAFSGKPYTLKLRGNINIAELLTVGHIRINHGQGAFAHAMPAGYRPWYVPSSADDPSGWLTPPWELTAGQQRPALAAQYWQWLLDRDPAQNPAADRTGAACALKQGDGYWYLAGAAAPDRVERRCAVPFGMPLVVPVMAVLLPFDNPQDCARNARIAALSPFSLQNTFMEINGIRMDRLQDYSVHDARCEPMQVAGKVISHQAVWLGLWVPLRPLPRGEHVVTFGGRFNAMNFDRRVTYRIQVR
ncbi:MAG: hypothetical protein AB7P37_20885 [Ramlibacter sp.]